MKYRNTIYLLALCILGVIACDDENTNLTTDSNAIVVVDDMALVVTTDYASGALYTVATDNYATTYIEQEIHSDNVCRYDALTGNMYVVSRMGSDAISVINPYEGWNIQHQYSVEAGSNAQDIAIATGDRAYVPRFGSASLLVVHPVTGAQVEQIDLSVYADEDGIPEAASAVAMYGKVYVSLQRLDPNWMPTDYSSILVLQGSTGDIIEEIRLTAKNPSGRLRVSEALQSLVVFETGQYGVFDGGIETLSYDGTLSGLIITEEQLGGDVVDAVIASETKGFAVVSVYTEEAGSTTQLKAFNPQTKTVGKTLIASAGFDLGYISLNGDSELWVADRNATTPGLRIFDVSSETEILQAPIYVGLPPTMVCFVD